MSALAARGIRKSFGRRQVLTGVDLKIVVLRLRMPRPARAAGGPRPTAVGSGSR